MYKAPAHTYATPSRAIRAVEKLHVDRGGKEVRFVLSKDSKGRYFPVFIDRVKQVPDSEIAANPNANLLNGTSRRGPGRPRKNAAEGNQRQRQRNTRQRPAAQAKNATKQPARRTRGSGKNKNTVH